MKIILEVDDAFNECIDNAVIRMLETKVHVILQDVLRDQVAQSALDRHLNHSHARREEIRNPHPD